MVDTLTACAVTKKSARDGSHACSENKNDNNFPVVMCRFLFFNLGVSLLSFGLSIYNEEKQTKTRFGSTFGRPTQRYHQRHSKVGCPNSAGISTAATLGMRNTQAVERATNVKNFFERLWQQCSRVHDMAQPSREMWMVSLPALVQRKVDSCALFQECFRQALQKKRNHLELLIYWDEAVPGNPLSPDLSRKSALWYMSFPDFPVTFLDTCWLTLALCRTEDLQQAEEGYCKAMTILLRRIVSEVKDGFTITVGKSVELVLIRKVSFLADGDGIRACTGSKGASGKKCCFRCSNVLSGNHIAVPGHEHISSHAVERFEPSSSATICSIATYLRGINVASTRAKAETMLGWKASALQESFLVDPNLKSWIGLSDILYDPMHCYVSNGIVNQEIGLWWTNVLKKSTASIQNFQQYVATCWSQCGPDTFDMKKICSGKLLQSDRDYRGDASQTLSILPLAVAFSQEVLVEVYPDLSLEIQSLMALHEVILAWMACKFHQGQREIDVLAAMQKKHAKSFVETYGWEVVRPKLHFSLHLPRQFSDKGYAPDAFATERQTQIFQKHSSQQHSTYL